MEGDNLDEEDKDQLKDSPTDKDKGKDKAEGEPRERAEDKGQRKQKVQTTRTPMSQWLSQSHGMRRIKVCAETPPPLGTTRTTIVSIRVLSATQARVIKRHTLC